jgi:hypothetical protein
VVCPAQETRRLAVVDLDWANITAVDILSVVRSFAPEGGAGEAGVTPTVRYGTVRYGMVWYGRLCYTIKRILGGDCCKRILSLLHGTFYTR